jgi:hypothetical protein
MLKLLLKDIEKYSKEYKIFITVFDDCSIPMYDLNSFNVKHIRFCTNNGKQNYWKLIDTTFKYIKNIESKYYIYLPDDIRLIPDFFNKCIKKYTIIKDENKLLNILVTKQRKGQLQWTGFKPISFRTYFQTQWCDMCFICERNMFKILNFTMEPISLSRWKNNSNLSSGVGRQISIRLNTLGFKMFQVKYTLVKHDDHPSIMNINEREINPLIT